MVDTNNVQGFKTGLDSKTFVARKSKMENSSGLLSKRSRGLNFFLRCNYDEKYLTSLPMFYGNILKYFRELKTLYNHNQDQNIILHNNKDILVGGRPF